MTPGAAPLRFGTDGIRGDARSVLNAPLVRALAAAAAEILGADGFAVGRDPRESGPELAAAVHAGVAAARGSSVDLGVLATPAVALWCASRQVAGAMVSASHNPWHDNGVKLFAPGGAKPGPELQDRIQARFDELWATGAARSAAAASTVDRHAEALAAHVDSVYAAVAPEALAGLRIVVDAANGAASEAAPQALRRLGAEVSVICAAPDGRNINADCGSTDTTRLQAAVTAAGADAGLAFDGDADRVLAVDHRGSLVDGDEIMAICALDAKRRGELAGDAVVVTKMTNLGFRRSMAAAGIEVIETEVGDRHVLAALHERGLALGGEQSGHIIFADLAPGGDGLLSAVVLAGIVARSQRRLADLAAEAMTKFPQVLVNVAVSERPADLDVRLSPVTAAAQQRLSGRGRVLVRASGTEPVVRVMVEAETQAEAAMEADALAAAITGLLR